MPEEQKEKVEQKKQEEQKESEEHSIKQDRIRQASISYYSRKDVQAAMVQFGMNREVVPRYFEGFGKRPDSLQYESDVFELVKKGATSFHCSEEIWTDPLRISNELSEVEVKELRSGWDLLIDIDSPYLDYSKVSAKLLVDALKFHNIKSFSIKFSGSKGMHILIPWKAFPKEVYGQKTSEMFPEWPRAIVTYLNKFIEKQLVQQVGMLANLGEKYQSASKYIRGDDEVGDAVKKVIPDMILVSPRHLFRMPYSLHEKTALASVVIDESEIETFEPKFADPLKIRIRNYYPDAKEGEAKELLLQALDYAKRERKEEQNTTDKIRQPGREIKIDVRKIVYPPCISKLLNGMQDGKKRGLFILMNYLRSLNLEKEEVEKAVDAWNLKNKPTLKPGYIKSQFDWQYRQKPLMPPNCDKDWYKGIGICQPDALCQQIKNPVNYTMRKMFAKSRAKRK